MSHIRAFVPIALLVLSALMPAQAQIDLDDPDTAQTIRAKYVQTADLPDGLAFSIMIHNLSAVNTEDRESAINWIEEGMGLSFSESEQFLDYLLDTLALLSADYDNIARDLACAPNRLRPAGEEIFPVFEALDDTTATLGTRYLAITKHEIGRERAARLQGWLASSKFGITHVTFRQKEHWEQTGGNPNEALYGICSRLDEKLPQQQRGRI